MVKYKKLRLRERRKSGVGSHSFICIRGDYVSKKFGGGTVVEKIESIVEPIAEGLGLDIWDIKFLKEGPDWYLRIFIDSDKGITVEDCEEMSRALDKPLEENDPVSQSYYLEVCSPGIERELKYEWHFKKFINRDVLIRLIRPSENGEKEIRGRLAEINNNAVSVSDGAGNLISVQLKDASYVKLDDYNK